MQISWTISVDMQYLSEPFQTVLQSQQRLCRKSLGGADGTLLQTLNSLVHKSYTLRLLVQSKHKSTLSDAMGTPFETLKHPLALCH